MWCRCTKRQRTPDETAHHCKFSVKLQETVGKVANGNLMMGDIIHLQHSYHELKGAEVFKTSNSS